MQTHYQVLGVPPAASLEDIKSAYRTLAFMNHADQGVTNEAKMMELNDAYTVLKHESSRREYDKYLRLMFTKCIQCNGEGVTWKQKGFTKREAVPCQLCNGKGFE